MIDWLKQQYNDLLFRLFPVMPSYIVKECYEEFDKEFRRMTENKRFTTDNGSHEDVCLVDNLTKKEYESNFEDIVSLMNDIRNQTQRFEKHNQRLEKENEQLKIDLGIAEDNHKLDKEIIDDIHNEFQKVKKENEQLKEQNKGLRETIERQNDWEKKAITEIEQLKQQIQQLKQWNKCLAEKRHNELKGDVK